MKKLVSVFCLSSVVMAICICVSCTQSKEEKVSKKFKQYVHENIDDPRTLKEIVSVTLNDTIDQKKFKEAVHMLDSIFLLNEMMDSIYLEKSSLLRDKMTKIASRLNNTQRNKIASLIMQSITYLEEDKELIFELGKNKDYYEEYLDSCILRMESLKLFQYEIKARFKNNDSLVLKKYYALEDSASIRIFDHIPTFDDYSKECSDFYNTAKEYENLLYKKSVISQKKLDIESKMRQEISYL